MNDSDYYTYVAALQREAQRQHTRLLCWRFAAAVGWLLVAVMLAALYR